jgi:hypothetical protein
MPTFKKNPDYSHMELVFDEGRGQQLLNSLHNQRTFLRKQMREWKKAGWLNHEAAQADIANITRITHMLKEIHMQYLHARLA